MSALAAVLVVAAVQAAGAAGVEGVVTTSGGGPLPYARVQVVGDSIADWTDEEGRYRLAGLGRGEWPLRVVHPGHDSLELAVVVPGDRRVRLDIALEPRPGPAVDALADFEPFRVEHTLPSLLNAPRVSALMQRLYPPELTRRRLGGESVLLIWLDEGGRVVRSRLSASSGQPALDAIALAVADSMRFRAARSGREPVRVIVRIPVVFTVPDSVPVVEAAGVGAEGSGRR